MTTQDYKRTNELNLELHKTAASKLPQVLEQFGYTGLREGQSEPINALMMGFDVICILPTGQGKSSVASIPTLCCEWRTLIFSPLISLMRDQVQSMCRLGIRAGCISSNDAQTNSFTLREWAEGNIQMLYVAPERLSNPQFLQALASVQPDLIVIDEAHCLSEWGHDFRPSYVHCGKFIEQFNPKAVLAMTATATNQVIDDIKNILHMGNASICKHYPARRNLKLKGELTEDAQHTLDRVTEILRNRKGSAIVYCQTTKQVDSIHAYLCGALNEYVVKYHGGMPDSEKPINQDDFMTGRARICVATNAFGMGIDKADIETIIHTGPPCSIEAVVQETGRAARDGRDAECYMFCDSSGKFMQEYFWSSSNPEGSTVRDVYSYLEAHADSECVARVTGKDLDEAIDRGASTVLHYLDSIGCVERFNSEVKIWTITILDQAKAPSDTTRNTISTIIEGGVIVSEENDIKTYAIDLAWVASRRGMSETSIKNHITQLAKEHAVTYVSPFKGKCTRLIHPPTEEDIIFADKKRMQEYNKLIDVRNYITIPDEEKHDYLLSYFNI